MAKQNVAQEVKKRMAEMIEKKRAELDAIQQKQGEARTQIEAAGLAIKDATERMDLDAYEEAKQAKHKAQTALDMYTGRYKQIAAQEYITEEESDKVIDSLLAYEEEIAAEFKKAVAEPLRTLAKLLTDYRQEVKDTEALITSWQRDIHANYNTRGATTYVDEFTGQQTHRSKTPVPVRRGVYDGCNEAAQMETYLKNAAPLYKG